jgi:hypothetical protein
MYFYNNYKRSTGGNKIAPTKMLCYDWKRIYDSIYPDTPYVINWRTEPAAFQHLISRGIPLSLMNDFISFCFSGHPAAYALRKNQFRIGTLFQRELRLQLYNAWSGNPNQLQRTRMKL